MASGRRPEHQAPPEVFYNDDEARKYTSNTRMIEIQVQLSQRAIELLDLPEDQPSFLLDIGCGSGLSGEVLTELGHQWVGLDISPAMLDVAVEREVEGDLFLHDIGQGLCFKPGTFDGCISISALQWLCNADKKGHNPAKRLYKFFSSLYSSMSRGSRAVFQFYPENPQQVELITTQAMKAGFTGGLVVDYPNSTRAKKALALRIPNLLRRVFNLRENKSTTRKINKKEQGLGKRKEGQEKTTGKTFLFFFEFMENGLN
ncbi:hypothetical protein pdam_00018386 [Pocillopora damicornis]|uniref:18S rRNA (guanine-N(7))-methyltransferase n=1 Tax=Pocillopora damicornis TaxID=46731 RepID=A0A3M6U8I9_POCDA|nr:hypothetical protein pdam_00018386 [Pocillopora damicornis]